VRASYLSLLLAPCVALRTAPACAPFLSHCSSQLTRHTPAASRARLQKQAQKWIGRMMDYRFSSLFCLSLASPLRCAPCRGCLFCAFSAADPFSTGEIVWRLVWPLFRLCVPVLSLCLPARGGGGGAGSCAPRPRTQLSRRTMRTARPLVVPQTCLSSTAAGSELRRSANCSSFPCHV
jgi:hypothetical protein